MKASQLVISISSLFTLLVEGSSSSTRARMAARNYAKLNEKELAEFIEKDGEELTAWVLGKKLDYGDYDDGVYGASKISTSNSGSSLESTTTATTTAASDTSTDAACESIDSNLERESPSPVSSSSSSSSPKVSFCLAPSVKFEQKLLVSMSDAIRSKQFKLASKFLKFIRNWKMTFTRDNFSVLSLIHRYGNGKFNGRLNHPKLQEIFEPFISGSNYRLSKGYLAALTLFKPELQVFVIKKCIEGAPHLRGALLQVAIYFKFDESVISLLIDSGALIRFDDESDEPSPLKCFPSLKKRSRLQTPTISKFFMNFYCPPTIPSFGISKNLSTDPEVNFLYGMLEDHSIEEVGAFRVAFETYKPEIVMALLNLSPLREMTNYHLAYLLALNPEKQKDYPAIETLVDSSLVFEKLLNGESEIIALPYLSNLDAETQVQAIKEFLEKTDIFTAQHLNNPRIIVKSTLKNRNFFEQTKLSELPCSPAHAFFLAACKWNLCDSAFELIYKRIKPFNTKALIWAKSAALKWAEANNQTGKVEIMTRA